jgi:catalase
MARLLGMVHASGSGAFGYFESTKDMSRFTKAGLFCEPNRRTPIFVRFSTVTFGREFPDSGRNPRGFAIKHYTEDGNYDVVGLNWVCLSSALQFYLISE